MPKSLTTAMLAYIQQQTQCLVIMVRVERLDGVILGFTSWDLIINYSGNVYWPTASLQPSAVKANADMTTDQMEVVGAIDSTLITEADLDAGRYDNAKVFVFRVNPLDLTMGAIQDLTGNIGTITYGEGNINIALNSIGQKATQQIGDIITPLCRVRQLGDSQCKVNIASYQFARSVTAVISETTLQFTDSHATGYYNYGMVRFSNVAGGGGANYSLSMEIKKHTLSGGNAVIELVEPMPFAVQVNDNVILEAGCDRRGLTCRTKFNNLVNFHGDLWVIGNDALLRTGRPPS